MSPFLSGPTRWEETLLEEIKIYITSITKIEVIELWDIVGFSGPVSQSWEVETIYASTPQTRIIVRIRTLKGCCATVILRSYQCYLCDPKEGFQPCEWSNDDISTIKS